MYSKFGWIYSMHICVNLCFVALVGFESNNKYEIKNSMGQNVFYAVEENDCLTRQCCGPLRSFTIRVLDNFGQEVITVSRPLKCMSCFFPCCLQEVSTLGTKVQCSWVCCGAKCIICTPPFLECCVLPVFMWKGQTLHRHLLAFFKVFLENLESILETEQFFA